MRRTIRLNERDLSRIVKKIIEQEEYNIENALHFDNDVLLYEKIYLFYK